VIVQVITHSRQAAQHRSDVGMRLAALVSLRTRYMPVRNEATLRPVRLPIPFPAPR
jgi:hypothetical protein